MYPWYAAPHLVLARAQRSLNRKDDAVASVNRFLARAAKTDLRRKDAALLLAALTGSPP